jgi:hypothetical protein
VKRPTIESGLGIIDPRSQHQALQLRWRISLLGTSFNDTRSTSSRMMAVTWIKIVTSYIMNTDTVQMFPFSLQLCILSTWHTLDLWEISRPLQSVKLTSIP